MYNSMLGFMSRGRIRTSRGEIIVSTPHSFGRILDTVFSSTLKYAKDMDKLELDQGMPLG